jgi:hypothetical protein
MTKGQLRETPPVAHSICLPAHRLEPIILQSQHHNPSHILLTMSAKIQKVIARQKAR